MIEFFTKNMNELTVHLVNVEIVESKESVDLNEI